MTDYEGIMMLTAAMMLESQASILRLVMTLAVQEAGCVDILRDSVESTQKYCDQMIEAAQALREASDDR